MDDRITALTDAQKINAIVWAAKDFGLSYGEFSIGLSKKEKESIYCRYADKLRERRAAEKRRLTAKGNCSRNQKRGK